MDQVYLTLLPALLTIGQVVVVVVAQHLVLVALVVARAE